MIETCDIASSSGTFGRRPNSTCPERTPGPPSQRTSWGTLIAAVALVVSACSDASSDSIIDDSSGSAEATQSTVSSTGDSRSQVDTNGSELTDSEIADVTGFYTDFLALSDEARLGDDEANAVIADLASSQVVAEIDAWRAENEELMSDDIGIEGLTSSPNVVSITGSTTELSIEDCVEVSQDRQLLGLDTYRFVDQVVTLHAVENGWLIDSIDVRADGSPALGPISCAPDSHRDRVEQSTADLLKALSALFAAPDGDLTREVTALMEEQALTDLRQEVDELIQSGWVLSSPEEHTIEVLGSDTINGGRTFVVSACTYFPEGRPARSAETGDVIVDFDSPIKPQSYFYQEFYVRTTTAESGRLVDKFIDIRDQELNSLCGEI